MTTPRIALASLALAALALPTLAQGGFSTVPSGGGGPTIKMGKPSPEMAKKARAAREKLLKDLKLTPDQKKKWDATEAKYRDQRMALIKKLQSGGGGDMMGNIQKLQALGEKEKQEKNALLTLAQRKILAASPGGGSGMTMKTMGGPPQ
jgi:hypothetical protein